MSPLTLETPKENPMSTMPIHLTLLTPEEREALAMLPQLVQLVRDINQQRIPGMDAPKTGRPAITPTQVAAAAAVAASTPPPVVAPTPALVAPPVDSGAAVTVTDCRAACGRYAQTHGNDATLAKLTEFGCGKVSEIPADKRAAFVAFLGV